MNLLETLQAHKGSLIRLKTQLYWHDGRGYDGTPGRICLILDAAAPYPRAAAAATTTAATSASRSAAAAITAALLLIDGQLQWIWVAKEDVELL